MIWDVIQGRGYRPQGCSPLQESKPCGSSLPGALPDPKHSPDLQQENAATSPKVTHRVKHHSPAPAQPSAGPWKLLVSQDTAPDTPARTWQTPLAKTKPPWWAQSPSPPSRAGGAAGAPSHTAAAVNPSPSAIGTAPTRTLQPPLGRALGGRNVPGTLKLSPTRTFSN